MSQKAHAELRISQELLQSNLDTETCSTLRIAMVLVVWTRFGGLMPGNRAIFRVSASVGL
jgi:hypothetical protein